MSDSRDSATDPPIDSSAFEEWVAHTAESRGVEKHELLNQLVSAFWVLDEMNDVAGTGEIAESDLSEAGLTERRDAVEEDDRDPSRQADSRETTEATDEPESGDTEETGSDGSGDADAQPSTHPPAETSTDKTAAREINELRESMQMQLEMVQTVSELRRELGDISLDVERQRSRHDEFTDRITDELTRLHGRVESLDADGQAGSELNERVDAIEETVAEVDQTVETLTDTIKSVESIETIETTLTELDNSVETLASDHAALDAWVEDEFDDIEMLFGRLIDITDDLEDRLDGLEDQLSGTETDVETALDAVSNHDAIADIRKDALASGIDTGDCEACGTPVDLSMLDAPVCPECDSTFDGVDAETPFWNPFATPTITTRPKRLDME